MPAEELPRRQAHRDQQTGSGQDRIADSSRLWPASSRFLRPWNNHAAQPKPEDPWTEPVSLPMLDEAKAEDPTATATADPDETQTDDPIATATTDPEQPRADDPIPTATGKPDETPANSPIATATTQPEQPPANDPVAMPANGQGDAQANGPAPERASHPARERVGGPVVEQRVLAQLVLLRNEVAGVDGSLVATSDGLLVVQDLPNLEPSRTAALIATTLSIARQATQLTDRGLLREAVIHGSSGYLAVFAVGDSAVLAVLGGVNLNVGMLHYQTRAIVKRIAKDAELFPRFSSTLPERVARISD